MIKSLHIWNFQSHKETFLEFSPGVNIIVGSSDSGKTAILRALNWGINNKPSGESFRSNWGGDTHVSLCLDNDNFIDRIKSDKDNIYRLNEEIFKSFGQDVPEEIKKIINITDVNFQYQMDAPFLLSKSPGEIARYLNKIVKLDEIDLSLSNITSRIRKNNQELQFKESQYKELKKDEEGFCWIDSAEKQLIKAEKLDEQLDQLRERKEGLSVLIDSIKKVEKEKEEINKILKARRMLNQALKMDNELEILRDKSKNLSDLIANIQDLKEDLGFWDDLLDAKDDLKEAFRLIEEISELKGRADNLNKLVLDIKQTKQEYEEWDSEYRHLKEKFNCLMPDVCPLCEQEIK